MQQSNIGRTDEAICALSVDDPGCVKGAWFRTRSHDKMLDSTVRGIANLTEPDRRVFWIMDNCSAHRWWKAVDRFRA